MKRLVRTIVYEGPDDWIEDCIAKRVIKGRENPEWLFPPRKIIETTMTVTTLSKDNAEPKKDPK